MRVYDAAQLAFVTCARTHLPAYMADLRTGALIVPRQATAVQVGDCAGVKGLHD